MINIGQGITTGQNTVNSAGMKASDYLNQLTSGKFKVKPSGLKGIGGFVFDYEADTSVTMSADITDHYAENGSVLNDHRVVKPLRVTLRGFVGELKYERTAGLAGFLSLLQSKMGVIPAYLGDYTPQMLGKVQAVVTKGQDVVNKINNYAERTKNIVGMFQKSAPGQTKQQQAFASLLAMHKAGTVMTVDYVGPQRPPSVSVVTPWVTLDSMMIETITITQDEGNKYQSDISVTLKEVRMAETKSSWIDPTQFSPTCGPQYSPATDKGQTKGKNQTGLDQIFHGIVG
jgi:hypothetical protein